MKKLFLLFLTIVFTTVLFSQTVLLEEDVAADTIPETFGPNLKKYRHLYLEYGFLADRAENDSMKMIYGHSHNLVFGLRYKYKISNFLALGWDIHISSWSYRIKQNDNKILPNDIKHDKERLTVSNLGVEFYTRLNFGKRGNHMGNFVDFAAFGNLTAGGEHYTYDKLDTVDINNANKVEVRNRGLNYLEPYNYGVKLRFGLNRYIFTATYRVSDIIKNNTYPELPRLFIGFQIGLH